MNRSQRRAIARGAARKHPNYAPRRAAQDVQPPADASNRPDGDVEHQALKNQPKVPAFHNSPANGGQFNV